MYRLYFAERDTTLYERHPDRNSGGDPILELNKDVSGSLFLGERLGQTYNSRIILDFDSQITALKASIAAGEIPPIGNGATSASAYINVRAASADTLPNDYTVYAYPVSESWSEGVGDYDDNPPAHLGASWYTRNGADSANPLLWDTGSGHSKGQTSTRVGGGTWITGSGYEASQSFNNAATPDIRMNVTDIIAKWVNDEIPNNGFMIKRSTSDETNSNVYGNIKFFSRDTNSIYIPRLEIAWDDSTLAGTGSFTEITSDIYVPYFKNIRDQYRDTEKAKFRIGVRPEFPSKSYQTSSFYLTQDRLPITSYYSIKDAVTEETIIPFDIKATRVSCDTNGNFIKLDLNTFLPERFYKIILKVERDNGNDVQIHDKGYYFKVVR